MMILFESGGMWGLIMVICGLWSFVSYNKHLLNTLLSLEFLMLGLFSVFSLLSSYIVSEVYFVLFFLTLAACEGALGLSLLVSVVRSHGSDCFGSFNVLGC
uniref:NADH-ubiquinone oxidoreductase chain 4L n=1 Tax=Axianassa australis TaxID=576642 RepID=A0A4Y5QJH2_9EUCA|nr:NADH dehydrogenase subunit 4L [Axianassa australis]QCX31748.1 NADH dehydrogenase subunit 4L [Axianassa australis]